MTITINGSGSITGLSAGGLPDATVTQADLAANVAANGPAFSAIANAAQSLATGTFVKIIMQTVDPQFPNVGFAVGATAVDAFSRFTAPVAGFYQINAEVGFASAVGIQSIQLSKNGVGIKHGSQFAMSAAQSFSQLSCVIYLAVNDYIELTAFQSSGGALSTVSGGIYQSYFQGFLARAA